MRVVRAVQLHPPPRVRLRLVGNRQRRPVPVWAAGCCHAGPMPVDSGVDAVGQRNGQVHHLNAPNLGHRLHGRRPLIHWPPPARCSARPLWSRRPRWPESGPSSDPAPGILHNPPVDGHRGRTWPARSGGAAFIGRRRLSLSTSCSKAPAPDRGSRKPAGGRRGEHQVWSPPGPTDCARRRTSPNAGDGPRKPTRLDSTTAPASHRVRLCTALAFLCVGGVARDTCD